GDTDIGCDGKRLPAHGGDFGGGRLGAGGVGVVIDGDIAPTARQFQRNPLANPFAGSGDQSCFGGEWGRRHRYSVPCTAGSPAGKPVFNGLLTLSENIRPRHAPYSNGVLRS